MGLADVTNLVVLRGPRVEGPSEEELCHHAAQGPHVDGLAEGQSQDDLGGPVVTRLQVSVADGFADVRGRSEVDDFDPVGLALRVQQHDVFRLEVRVDQAKLLQFQQRRQHLVSDGADVLQRQWLELVGLEKVVQILLQHLKHQAGVVLVRKALVRPDKVVLVGILLTQTGQNGHLKTKRRRVI